MIFKYLIERIAQGITLSFNSMAEKPQRSLPISTGFSRSLFRREFSSGRLTGSW